jgi:hypothetical protein
VKEKSAGKTIYLTLDFVVAAFRLAIVKVGLKTNRLPIKG